MAKTYVTDISDYLNDIGLLKPDMPTPIDRMARVPTCHRRGHDAEDSCPGVRHWRALWQAWLQGIHPRIASARRWEDHLVVPALRTEWRHQRLVRH